MKKKLKSWGEVQRAHFTEAQIQELRAEALAELEATEYTLAFLRRALGLTQSELAELLDKRQAEISLLERRGDHKLSTLRAYIAALGGTLEVSARFGDKVVPLVFEGPEAAA
jgi:DNA-directed RNA polymerase specialized sigma24 family protein